MNEFFEECNRLVSQDRQESYGDSTDGAIKVMSIFNAYYGTSLPPSALHVMMIILKLHREGVSHKVDNNIDGANYFYLLNKLKERGVE